MSVLCVFRRVIGLKSFSYRSISFTSRVKVSSIESRKMDCKQFTLPLYDAWGWDKECVYRSVGQLVTYERKVMLLFDFNYPEKWKGKGLENKNV